MSTLLPVTRKISVELDNLMKTSCRVLGELRHHLQSLDGDNLHFSLEMEKLLKMAYANLAEMNQMNTTYVLISDYHDILMQQHIHIHKMKSIISILEKENASLLKTFYEGKLSI